uniref:NADH-ubiquinone oxidoreductase chain 4 n=1 Tax=Scolopsis vosmeri TaxID=490285 RepID=A0A140CPS1_9TELE|nr:NADH dehydrogenase subunit 4 [Scolopsis vosmeri]AMH85782.1 NADH dehydrogenase subunit 4 [Scolopsis vosmeri]
MLKIIVPLFMLLPLVWILPWPLLWPTVFLHSMSVALASMTWCKNFSTPEWYDLNPYLASDPLSAPLLVLTCWLLPATVLASQKHLEIEPLPRQRSFLTLMILLQALVVLAFSVADLFFFYILFEATLLPTLLLLTRWGFQKERLFAGYYFLFYTLFGSLPLLIALLCLCGVTGTVSYLALPFVGVVSLGSVAQVMLWLGCLYAFIVKMPLYGAHLWLPKAHVEAPIAGSMILAAVLLKLGGYGLMRVLPLIEPATKELAYPFIILALWGVIMTGSICLRQTDLKSIIAYSSVSHMGLVAAGILIQTPWGLTGALILMIAHGLTSSALFCLANTNYERTHSRTMLLARGMQMLLPLMTIWWFIASLANLALPPLPNLMGELMIITSLFNWSWWTIILTGLGTLITASYSLFMFLMTQRGPVPPHILSIEPSHTREHLLMTLHLLPLLLLILKPELFWGWTA